jgi:hypothetical protein
MAAHPSNTRVGSISPVPSISATSIPPGSVSPATITPSIALNGQPRPFRLEDSAHHQHHSLTHHLSSSSLSSSARRGSTSGLSASNGTNSSHTTSSSTASAGGDALLGKIAALSGMSATELASEQHHETEEMASKREQRRILAGIMDEEESFQESKQLELIEHEDLLLHRSSTSGRSLTFSSTAEAALHEVVPRLLHSCALIKLIRMLRDQSVCLFVCNSEDPFDAAGFDPIEFLNQEFPDERSLSGGKLDAFLLLQRRRLLALSTGISHDIHEDSSGHGRNRAKKAIHAAQKSITELVARIRSIKEKASHSESMVQEISRDISILHQGKK